MTNVVKYVLRKWKDIPGEQFKGYQASKDGQIRKEIKPGHYSRLLHQSITQYGYLIATINGEPQRVHRLVAMAWKRPNKNRPFVNHKDGNKKNNWDWNLEWCTVTENNRHSYHVLDNDSQYPKRKVEIYKDGMLIDTKISVREAAKFVKGASTNVSKVCQGIRKQHNGYTFKYAETQPVTQPDLF